MTHPTADFPDDRTRWLIQALSLSSSDSVLMHLSQAWRQFTPAVAVLVCADQPSGSCGAFVREEEEPQLFPHLDLPRSLSRPPTGEGELLRKILPELPSDHLAIQPVVCLGENDHAIGRVWLWTSGEYLSQDFAWLKEASTRILANRRKLEAQLLRDKLEALGEFAAGAGHEINNPVATISGRVQGLLQRETDHERRRHLQTIGGQALRIRDMIGDTMLFARPPVPRPERVDLQTVLPEIVAPLRPDMEMHGADFQMEIAESVPIFADRTQLAVVITELLRNSLEWLKEGGRISLQATLHESPAGPVAQIVIEDDGESFTEEQKPHLFDPFFSGRQAGRGLGFGLPKCWRIVSNHHGTLDIASRPEQGTRLIVTWPAYDFQSPAP